MISPKLLNIEGNRVGTEGGTYHIIKDEICDGYKDTSAYLGVNKYKYKMYNDIGRFPTQLFTNIDDEKYKYVKNIKNYIYR